MSTCTTRPAKHRPCIDLVAGARPNFMKIAPLVRALREDGGMDFRIVHTGQHYDRNMSAVFFEELGIPEPDVHFECGGGTQAQTTARVMEAYEAHVAAQRPDAAVVVGDVNSTLACAIVARKAGVPVAHVEAGLRSGDMAMPEEINRIVTDSITNWHFVTEPAGVANLLREGHAADHIFRVGHVMVDNLLFQAQRLTESDRSALPTEALKARLGPRYGVVTLHRPANVDDPAALERLMRMLNALAEELPLAFAVHPRTRARLQAQGLTPAPRLHLLEPQPYMAFLNLWKDAAIVLTDSGGLQEETTALGVPCVTLRENTERPITVEEGTNVLAGTDPARVLPLVLQTLRQGGKAGRRPALWDGQASGRIVNILSRHLA